MVKNYNGKKLQWSKTTMVKNMYNHFTSTTTAYGTRNVRRPATLARLSLNINKIETTVSIDHTTHKKNTCSYTFNSQRDPSMYGPILPGTGRYTTSTTNMHNKDFTYVCCDNSRCNRSNVARMLTSCFTPCRPRLRALPSDPRDPCDGQKAELSKKMNFNSYHGQKEKLSKNLNCQKLYHCQKESLSNRIIVKHNHCQTESLSNRIIVKHKLGQTQARSNTS